MAEHRRLVQTRLSPFKRDRAKSLSNPPMTRSIAFVSQGGTHHGELEKGGLAIGDSQPGRRALLPAGGGFLDEMFAEQRHRVQLPA